MRKEDFKLEVERHLHGPDSEPWEIVHFKLYKSQVPVVEQALDVASLMLGSDKSRGYCLEMTCADFLADAHEHERSPVALRNALCRLIRAAAKRTTARDPKLPIDMKWSRLDPPEYNRLRQRVFRRDNWRCQQCGVMQNLEIHHQTFRSQGGNDVEPNVITLCHDCHQNLHKHPATLNYSSS